MAANIALIIAFTLYLIGVYSTLDANVIRESFKLCKEKGYTKGQTRLTIFAAGTLGAPLFIWYGFKEIRFQIWCMYAKFIITQCVRILNKYPD